MTSPILRPTNHLLLQHLSIRRRPAASNCPCSYQLLTVPTAASTPHEPALEIPTIRQPTTCDHLALLATLRWYRTVVETISVIDLGNMVTRRVTTILMVRVVAMRHPLTVRHVVKITTISRRPLPTCPCHLILNISHHSAMHISPSTFIRLHVAKTRLLAVRYPSTLHMTQM